jgi:predicted dehydrogenase
MKFLIAGLGSIGRRHLRNLLALGEQDIVLYRTHQSTMPDDELKGFPVETDLQAALDHHPQAVVIANPTALHMEVAIPAAEAGCHLLLEKPVAESLVRLEELAVALERGGGHVLVGFQFRFHPGLQRVVQLLAEGAIGRPLSVHAHLGEYLPGWHPWEDYRLSYSAREELGGGVILTQCHPFDYLRWIFGEVNALWAFTGRLSDLELNVEDTAEIGLRFASGVLGNLHLDYNQRPPSHSLEVIGTLGRLCWDNSDGSVAVYRADSGEHSDGDRWRIFPAPDGFERNTMFLDEMRHFIAVVHGEVAPRCTLKDGVKALSLALAARASGHQGKLMSFED